MRIETRPWGRFVVLYEDKNTWLKRIIISPGQSLSYQYHMKRVEFWYPEDDGIRAEIKGFDIPLYKNPLHPIVIYPQVEHRIYNPGQQEVRVLEWVTGSPDESDIVRLKDDYGRAS